MTCEHESHAHERDRYHTQSLAMTPAEVRERLQEVFGDVDGQRGQLSDQDLTDVVDIVLQAMREPSSRVLDQFEAEFATLRKAIKKTRVSKAFFLSDVRLRARFAWRAAFDELRRELRG